METDLGCFTHKSVVDFGLISGNLGDYVFKALFNGQVWQATAAIGAAADILFSAALFNEDYIYRGELFNEVGASLGLFRFRIQVQVPI